MTTSTADVNDDFVRAFHEHYPGMCRFVRRYVGSDAAAEDIVQDVWATLWERGADANRLTKAYLYTAARNRAFHALEHQSVETRHTEAVQAAAPLDLVSENLAELNELAAAARRAVDALPDRCRTIFRMVRNDGLSYAETAAVLNVSVSTIEVQMWRALKKLRQAMAPFLMILSVAAAERLRLVALPAMIPVFEVLVKVEGKCPVLLT